MKNILLGKIKQSFRIDNDDDINTITPLEMWEAAACYAIDQHNLFGCNASIVRQYLNSCYSAYFVGVITRLC